MRCRAFWPPSERIYCIDPADLAPGGAVSERPGRRGQALDLAGAERAVPDHDLVDAPDEVGQGVVVGPLLQVADTSTVQSWRLEMMPGYCDAPLVKPVG